MQPSADKLQLGRRVNGQSTVFKSPTFPTEFGLWYTMTIAAQGNDLSFGLDDQVLTAASDGYAPVAYAIADLNPADGNNPAYRDNSTEILFDYNTGGSNWETITGVAILSGSTVLQVVSADSPVTIAPGRRVRIAAGALQLRTDSV
jgi:hypothetical protein